MDKVKRLLGAASGRPSYHRAALPSLPSHLSGGLFFPSDNPSISGIPKLLQCNILANGDLTDPVLPFLEGVGANPAAYTPFSTGFPLNPPRETSVTASMP